MSIKLYINPLGAIVAQEQHYVLHPSLAPQYNFFPLKANVAAEQHI